MSGSGGLELSALPIHVYTWLWYGRLPLPALQSEAMIPSRFVNTDAARALFGDRVDRLAPFLGRVDPLADEAVEALSALGGGGFHMLESTLTSGNYTDRSVPKALQTFLAEATRIPAWLDWPTVDSGGSVLLRTGLAGGLVLGAFSLPLGYASPGGNKPLAFSGRLTEHAPRRLAETSRFVQAVSQRGGMRPGGDGLKITLKVRLMHAHVRRALKQSDKWDYAAWGEPINQHDMAATTILFSLVVLEGLRKFGFEIDHDEAEKYMHLWRYVGTVSGVDPDLVPASQLEARALAELIRVTQGPPDDDSRALVRALVDTPISGARTPEEKKTAPVRAQVARGLVRALCGPELSDQFGIGKTPWENVLRLIRTGGKVSDRASKLSPFGRQKAILKGERYWEEVVKIGLRGGPYEYKPPPMNNV
ncbi:MAG: DUF2236 domain-containing protein [Polyangiaceae bacterium]|nr:DUF2236 domain-containing protein [Polyangiaceae bacterium]